MVTAADERRHRPTSESQWEESWQFDFVAGEGEVGGLVRLTLRPAERRAWWWTAIVGRGRPLVTVRDHDIDPPRGGSFEVRASGLWAELVCEEPLEHWSVGMEAFAVALDDPAEAYGAERGDPVALGLDMGWEASAPVVTWPDGGLRGRERNGGRYAQPCVVAGLVLVGDERLTVDGVGVREHAWGPAEPSSWAAGRLDSGDWLGPGPDVDASLPLDERQLLAPGHLRAGDGREAQLEPIFHAPFQVSGPGQASFVATALCRLTAGAETGWGWAGRRAGAGQPA